MTPRRWIAIGVSLCALLCIVALVLAWVDRWVFLPELFRLAGDCVFRDGPCSGGFATWGLVLVSSLTLVAAGVAALYTRQAALSTSDAAHFTRELVTQATSAGNHTRALAELEHRLVARLRRCPVVDEHEAEEPVAVYWINDHFQIDSDEPDGSDVFECLFEARNIGRSPILDLQFNATLHLTRAADGRPAPIRLGDIGPDELVHFVLRSKAAMVARLPEVRVSFGGGRSRDGELFRDVHVSEGPHKVNFLTFDMNILPSR